MWPGGTVRVRVRVKARARVGVRVRVRVNLRIRVGLRWSILDGSDRVYEVPEA